MARATRIHSPRVGLLLLLPGCWLPSTLQPSTQLLCTVAHTRSVRQFDNNRLITTGTCMIGTNNDRPGSFLCSFQTFQTFINVVPTGRLGACTTRDTEHLPDGVQPNLSVVSVYTVHIFRCMGHPLCSNFNLLGGH